MELRLAHGRDDPDAEMDGWGFEGPTLLQVDSMQQIYGETTTVRFLSCEAAQTAQALIGWPTWDGCTLEMLRYGDLIETHERDSASPRFYADLFLFHRNASNEIAEASTHARRAAISLQNAIHCLQRKFSV